jgi:hypothetical protein
MFIGNYSLELAMADEVLSHYRALSDAMIATCYKWYWVIGEAGRFVMMNLAHNDDGHEWRRCR